MANTGIRPTSNLIPMGWTEKGSLQANANVTYFRHLHKGMVQSTSKCHVNLSSHTKRDSIPLSLPELVAPSTKAGCQLLLIFVYSYIILSLLDQFGTLLKQASCHFESTLMIVIFAHFLSGVQIILQPTVKWHKCINYLNAAQTHQPQK